MNRKYDNGTRKSAGGKACKANPKGTQTAPKKKTPKPSTKLW